MSRASDEDGLARGRAKQTGSTMQLAGWNSFVAPSRKCTTICAAGCKLDGDRRVRESSVRASFRSRQQLVTDRVWTIFVATGDGARNAVRAEIGVERDAQIRARGRSCTRRKATSNVENELDESMNEWYVGFMLDGGSLLIVLVSFVGASRRLW